MLLFQDSTSPILEVNYYVFLAQESPAVSVVSSNNLVVYCGDSNGYVYAINTKDGTLKWRSYFAKMAISAAPVISSDGSVLYIGPTQPSMISSGRGRRCLVYPSCKHGVNMV